MSENNIGIIAEFNPFHNGHNKLIKEIKLKNKNATIICAMSGNFVQRGEIAINDKWNRAKDAINAGVDLIIEIPPYFVLNNANIFAKKAVQILNSLDVSEIYFGSETMEINEIEKIANLLITKNDELEKLKKIFHSLPKALENLTKTKIKSNDLLGICYVLEAKKLNLNIKFNRIKRIFNDEFTSASLLREKMKKEAKYLDLEDYSDLIIGKIITSSSNSDIIKYIKKNAIKKSIKSFNELIDETANNAYTKSNLRRELIKFVVEINPSDQYIVLGCAEKGKNVLKSTNLKYSFRHNQSNIENLKVESFLSIKRKESLSQLLSKSTFIKD